MRFNHLGVARVGGHLSLFLSFKNNSDFRPKTSSEEKVNGWISWPNSLATHPEIVDQLKGKGERGRRKDQRSAICCLTASSGSAATKNEQMAAATTMCCIGENPKILTLYRHYILTLLIFYSIIFILLLNTSRSIHFASENTHSIKSYCVTKYFTPQRMCNGRNGSLPQSDQIDLKFSGLAGKIF